MALVNDVILEINCPFCKNPIYDFQTSYSLLDQNKIQMSEPVLPEDCVNIFGVCNKCKAQLEFRKDND